MLTHWEHAGSFCHHDGIQPLSFLFAAVHAHIKQEQLTLTHTRRSVSRRVTHRTEELKVHLVKISKYRIYTVNSSSCQNNS